MLAPFSFLGGGAGIDAQAQAHYNRVIADGGLIPSGLVGVNNFFKTVKGIYGTSDITTAISVGLDAQVLGYNLGAGVGTTAGQAAQKLYSCSGASGDVEQTFASSQPLLLVHSGVSSDNYYQGVISGDNYLISNTTYATSDFDIEFSIKFDGGVTTQRVVNGNTSGNPFSFIFNSNTGNITIEYYQPTYKVASCSVSLTGTNTFRISRNSTTGVITVLKNGVSQTVTGDQVSGNISTTITQLQLCNLSTLNQGFQGKMYWCKFYIGGSLVRYMNPAEYNAATSQTQWTSSTTGETWTINTGTAATGYKGVLVDRTIVQGDGIDDTLTDTATYNQPYTVYNVGRVENAAVLVKSNSGGGYLSYVSNDTIRMIGGLSIVFANAGIIYRKRNLISAVFNSASSVLSFNNSISTTGNSGTDAITTVFQIFDSNNSTQNTIIISSSADNSTIRTSMYDYVRSINGNSF
jgi:hypothetical protein